VAQITLDGHVRRFGPDDLSFVTWHESPGWARTQLRDWVGGMKPRRDGELGGTPWGALQWVDKKIALSVAGGLFQTFLALHGEEVVWTGSVVQDDRGVKARLRDKGLAVDAFYGLFNTRYTLRGLGIGWAGANHVNNYVQHWVNSSKTNLTVALFTANEAAERHYRSVGFTFFKKIFMPDFSVFERVYVKTYSSKD